MADRSGGIPRSFMRDFIDVYKSLPCLWNPKARDFNYRSAKATAYGILVDKYREVEPGASKETVQQRLSSLRNCRRKELKKVKAAQDVGEIYTPQLWYYNLMSFIDDPELAENEKLHSKALQSLVTPQIELEEAPHTFEDSGSYKYAIDSPEPSHDSSELPEMDHRQTRRENLKREKERDDYEDDEEIFRYLKQRIKTIRTVESSAPPVVVANTQHIAFHWADKLATLKGEQRIFTEKLINDTFYEAEFGRLGHGCRIIPNSEKSQES